MEWTARSEESYCSTRHVLYSLASTQCFHCLFESLELHCKFIYVLMQVLYGVSSSDSELALAQIKKDSIVFMISDSE